MDCSSQQFLEPDLKCALPDRSGPPLLVQCRIAFTGKRLEHNSHGFHLGFSNPFLECCFEFLVGFASGLHRLSSTFGEAHDFAAPVGFVLVAADVTGAGHVVHDFAGRLFANLEQCGEFIDAGPVFGDGAEDESVGFADVVESGGVQVGAGVVGQDVQAHGEERGEIWFGGHGSIL
jgi:hypothetical protein